MSQINYIDTEEVLSIHNYIIEKTGGFYGDNNIGLIDSTIEHIRNDLYYPRIEDKVTHLLFSLIMNHPFNDANKRTALATSSLFLNRNGFKDIIDNFIHIMEPIIVLVASGEISKEQLKKIIQGILDI